MQLSISQQTEFDRLFWVPLSVFRSNFNVADADDRFVVNVAQGYLEAWFEETASGKSFIPPVVQLVEGRTQFINGRHRMAVLEAHLEAIPMAFDFRSSGMSEWVKALGLQPVDAGAVIELPDLPYLD